MLLRLLRFLFHDMRPRCPICGLREFPGIRDEGCFNPLYQCPRLNGGENG